MDRPCQNCQQYFDIREHYGKCDNCLTDNFKTNKPNNMKNFKDGQKVRHPKYGEGIFRKVGIFPNAYIMVFDEFETQAMQIGNDFYNQLEAVEDLPNVGEYAYFWDNNDDVFMCAKFREKTKIGNYLTEKGVPFSNVSKTPPFQ